MPPPAGDVCTSVVSEGMGDSTLFYPRKSTSQGYTFFEYLSYFQYLTLIDKRESWFKESGSLFLVNIQKSGNKTLAYASNLPNCLVERQSPFLV